MERVLIIHGLLLPALVKVTVLKAAGQKSRRVGEGGGGGFSRPFWVQSRKDSAHIIKYSIKYNM